MSLKECKSLFIVAAKRTAFESYGGSLKDYSITDHAALEAANVKPDSVDHIIFSNVIQSAKDAIYLALHVGLRLGIPESVPALIVNRLCGSGFQAIINAILINGASVVLAGGTENMSQAPFAVFRNIRFGSKLGTQYDLTKKLGAMYNITPEQADNFALRSQTLWKKGYLITFTLMKFFQINEHPRLTTAEAQLLKGIADGVAALVIAKYDPKIFYINPLVWVAAWYTVDVDPSIMGFGPVPVIHVKVKLEIRVNEAFVPQVLAVQGELKIPEEKLNFNGGAVALSYALAASGARTLHPFNLRNEVIKYGIGSACIGGGQGVTILLETP
uniref:Thiolase_N domain-containing protein n=1 Tax=Syphacia muris TaxID=451379 RepID=A0A0N5AEA6_9BILA